MSVIGIDFGNESCYIAAARAGGIETIDNDYSLRATPSCVAFSLKNRIIGVAAKNQMVTNLKNTVHSFKRMLGRDFNDPLVQNELKRLPFEVKATNTGGIKIKVNYLGKDCEFSPEQITAMLFTKLKEIAEVALKIQIHDCVISVPSYFTSLERKALLDAAAIAGLNVLRLFNETTATALAYGIYKQDLPLPEEKPRNVVFVDCGHTSLQVFACAFNKGKLKMLASAADPSLGGRDFDAILATYFAKDFSQRYRIDARGNHRAWLRLMTEVEKIKKQMSANSTKLPLNIECFMDDKDVQGEMKRSDMEGLCEHLFHRVEETLKKCLNDCQLGLDDIYAVEIVGGSSRIPAIKHLIEQIFHKPASTTLNQDEAVARGCALQCAMLSPQVRVRDFNITDLLNYPVSLAWDDSTGNMEVFSRNHVAPFSKMVTLYRKEPFLLKAFYSGEIPFPNPHIGDFVVKDVKPDAEGEAQKVKLKVRVNIHGIVAVTSASLVEKLKPEEVEAAQALEESADPMEAEKPEAAAPESPVNGGGVNDKENEEPTAPAPGSDKKKRALVKTTNLPIESCTPGYTVEDLNRLLDDEGKMVAEDRQEKNRIDARNALEEYVYELRNKLSCDGELATFVPDAEREMLCHNLDDTESWLYGEGEDCMRNKYADRLAKLKSDCEPIQHRHAEFESRETVLTELSALLQLTRKAVDQYHNGEERYSHVPADEMDRVQQAVDRTHGWLEDTRTALASCSRTHNPPVLCSKVREEKRALESIVNPILNKPKPKPKVESPPPPTKEEPKEGGGDAAKTDENMEVE